MRSPSNVATRKPVFQVCRRECPCSGGPRCAGRQRRSQSRRLPSVLAIGVSTGGPAALDVLLPALPADFPLPVLIVQHMPELFTRLFAERLNGRCRLRVREAAEGEPVRAGNDLHRARQLAHGGAGRGAHGRLGHAAPEPGPA